MVIWIFECEDVTQPECWQRNLFGAGKSWPTGVRSGDLCLLYNYTRGGEHRIYGVYRAVSNGARNIVPEAWEGIKTQIYLSGDGRGKRRPCRENMAGGLPSGGIKEFVPVDESPADGSVGKRSSGFHLRPGGEIGLFVRRGRRFEIWTPLAIRYS